MAGSTVQVGPANRLLASIVNDRFDTLARSATGQRSDTQGRRAWPTTQSAYMSVSSATQRKVRVLGRKRCPLGLDPAVLVG